MIEAPLGGLTCPYGFVVPVCSGLDLGTMIKLDRIIVAATGEPRQRRPMALDFVDESHNGLRTDEVRIIGTSIASAWRRFAVSMNLGPLLIVLQDISRPDRSASFDMDDRGSGMGHTAPDSYFTLPFYGT